MAKKVDDYVPPIHLKDEESGEEFDLDFSRETVKLAERRGFKPDEISEFPATRIPELFWLAFRKNHPRVSRQQTDDLLERLGGLSSDAITRLVQLYGQAGYSGLIKDEDDKEDDGKNATVTLEL